MVLAILGSDGMGGAQSLRITSQGPCKEDFCTEGPCKGGPRKEGPCEEGPRHDGEELLVWHTVPHSASGSLKRRSL